MRGNIKALTNEELKFVNERYTFNFTDNGIIVISNGRRTFHDANTSFSLLLPLERRRIKITKQAIDIWTKKYVEKYTLVEVQNAINTLCVTYQPVTEKNIDEQLKMTRSRLDNLY